MTSSQLVHDVPDTAFLVAGFRALETARPDALVRDDFADRLAGERGREIVRKHPRLEMGVWMMAVRTTIIDDYVRAAIERGVDTIVNLGAGLDARPYRLALPPELRWIEADFPSMIEHKTGVLAGETPHCALERVGLDLADRGARWGFLAKVAEQSKRALVLAEGVLPYLAEVDVAALADDLHTHACFESWIVDCISVEAHRLRERSGGELASVKFQFCPTDWVGFFAEHGWKRERVRYIPEAARELGRPAPLSWARRIGLALTSPERRRAAATFMGYAELVRA
ncbi:MAG TPA: SAM-dependent methyltransferase [Kofleriaceae bacterium]|jgi:methyltransferase (TIGR00027 family)